MIYIWSIAGSQDDVLLAIHHQFDPDDFGVNVVSVNYGGVDSFMYGYEYTPSCGAGFVSPVNQLVFTVKFCIKDVWF